MDMPLGHETMSPQMAHMTRYYRWVHDVVRPALGRRVVEVGPGYGNLGTLLLEHVDLYHGVDLDETIVQDLRRRFAGQPRAAFFAGDVCDPALRDRLRGHRYDTVVTMNVLEHLADPDTHLDALADLAPGATLVVFVPAMPALFGTLDVSAGHHRRYTRRTLHALLARHGEVRWMRYFNPLGAVAWFVAGRVLRLPLGSEETGRGIRVYDRWLVPASRRLDPLTRRLLGQSLVAVATLPG